MTFAIRHEGSPRAVTGLSAPEVVAGLADGRWEPTDEVRADGETVWSPLEVHPRFAEAAADVALPPRKHREDETRLDMNPLIDVALVLLIFFILTASYETIRKVLDMPGQSGEANRKTRANIVTPEQVKNSMIVVTARSSGGRPIITIESTPVALENLDAELSKRVRDSKKVLLLLDATSDVEYGVVMAVMDAARGAGIAKTLVADRPK